MIRRFEIDDSGLPFLPGMMLAVIEALKELGGSANIYELDERVIEIEGVTEEEQSYLMANDSNKPRVNYYLSWARTYLRRGGAVINSSRGVWALTESGSSITNIDETKAIYEAVNLEERQAQKQKKVQRQEKTQKQNTEIVTIEPSDENSPDDSDDWKSTLLDVIGKMHPSAFERLAQRLMREAGFTKVEVRGKSNDGGIDGIGILRVNLVSFQVYFQCKKWKGSVGSKEIRDFRGAVQGRADKGLFITTGHFTSQASDEATRDGAIAIDLIDGDMLCELLKENSLGVSVELVESVHVKAEWFDTI